MKLLPTAAKICNTEEFLLEHISKSFLFPLFSLCVCLKSLRLDFLFIAPWRVNKTVREKKVV